MAPHFFGGFSVAAARISADPDIRHWLGSLPRSSPLAQQAACLDNT